MNRESLYMDRERMYHHGGAEGAEKRKTEEAEEGCGRKEKRRIERGSEGKIKIREG